jgi:hypothetical protein
MRVANICWYLCGILAVSPLFTSTITVIPEAERTLAAVM